jgi:AhpD family alkylhydroperoxidase
MAIAITTNSIWSRAVQSAAMNSNSVTNAARRFSAIPVTGSCPGKKSYGRKNSGSCFSSLTRREVQTIRREGGSQPKKEVKAMDERIKELVAIGTSVGAHCQPCLEWHVGKARELGIDDETIREAIETGHMVEKGAMSAMRKFSTSILEQKSAPEIACCSDIRKDKGSCCG